MAYHGTNSSKNSLIGFFLIAIGFKNLGVLQIRVKEHVSVRI